jgi:REP element-mobilizing transposase RayT
VFLTWRLEGALPVRSEYPPPAHPLTEGQRFIAIDQRMDLALSGPVWLERPAVAACVAETLKLAEQQWKFYELIAWVIMPNHVHVLADAHRPPGEIGRAIRKTTARLANEILGRHGLPFWHDGSYEYFAQDEAEIERIARYIEANPVTAKLVDHAEEWPWSSAFSQIQASAGDSEKPADVMRASSA